MMGCIANFKNKVVLCILKGDRTKYIGSRTKYKGGRTKYINRFYIKIYKQICLYITKYINRFVYKFLCVWKEETVNCGSFVFIIDCTLIPLKIIRLYFLCALYGICLPLDF